MAIFQFFKMASAAILGFWNFKFLTVGTIKSVKLRHDAKFHQNRSNRGWYMAFLDLWCVCCPCWDHIRRIFGGRYHCAKFGWNRCSSFDNMHVFRFREFGLKTPIHADWVGDVITCDKLFGDRLRVEGCRFCRGSKIALSHWQSQSPLTRGWRYRAACGNPPHNRWFSKNILLYLTNGASSEHSYYGRLIGWISYTLYRIALFSVTMDDP